MNLSTSNTIAYSEKVLISGNSQSTLSNVFSFVGGGTWGYYWKWAENYFFHYYEIFTINPLFIVTKYIPIFIFFLSVWLAFKKRKNIFLILILFFIAIFIFFITSYKGPFGDLFVYGFNNSVIFKLFRESHNKFFQGLIFLISLFIFVSYKDFSIFYKKLVMWLFAIYIALFSSSIIVSGGFYAQNGFFKVPESYFNISKMIDDKSGVLVLPEFNTTKSYSFGHYGVSPFQDILKNPLVLVYTLQDIRYSNEYADYILNNFNYKSLNTILSKGSVDPTYDTSLLDETMINYIILDGNVTGPGNYDNDINFNQIKSAIDESSEFYFKYKDDNLYLYERNKEERRTYFATKDIFFTRINPTKFLVKMKNITDYEQLVFLQSFDTGWHAYLQNVSASENNCKVIEHFEYNDITECSNEDDFKINLRNDIFDDKHGVYNNWANCWNIDVNEIKRRYGSAYYIDNGDGSVDIELILYYKPQSYLILTVALSFVTVFGCFVYWIIGYRKRRKILFSKINNYLNE